MTGHRFFAPVPDPAAYYGALRGYERRKPVYIGLTIVCVVLAVIATGLPYWVDESEWMFGMQIQEIHEHLADAFDEYHAETYVTAIAVLPMTMLVASIIGIRMIMSHDRCQVEEIVKRPLRTLAYYMVNDTDNTAWDLNAYYDAFGTTKTLDAATELFKEYAPKK